MIKGKVTGINKVLKNFEKFGEEGVKDFAEITQIKAKDIAAMAKVNAPKNVGKLAQSISDERITVLRYAIEVLADYGGYVEFGTGAKVSVPPEFQKMANRLRGKGGSFEEGLQAIRDWCKQKGIEQRAAYPIFMSILRTGQNPQPYLYPAFVKGRAQYIKDLEKALKRLTKKYG